MAFHLLTIGRITKGPEKELFERYAKRLGSRFKLQELNTKKSTVEAETQALLEALPKNAKLIVLDERGENLSSPALASVLGRWHSAGISQIAFVVGGEDGHAPLMRERADLVLALGALTWPHQLVPALVAEQIYRVAMILDGHPYHK